jgi:hypothetical protein
MAEKTDNDNSVYLEYGDIVKLYAGNEELNEKTFYINYIDKEKINLINIANVEPTTLYLKPDGVSFRDESISQIDIISKSLKKGYIAQNNLSIGKWIEIYFRGNDETPITGEITNIEEDKMEVTIFSPNVDVNDVIYIDFEYKGIPEDIPIERITIVPKPDAVEISLKKQEKEEGDEPNAEEEEEEDKSSIASLEYTNENEIIINIPEKVKQNENLKDYLKNLYINSKDIIFDKKIEYVHQIIELNENKKIYGLEEQVTNLLDELLSTIPNFKRNKEVLNNITRIIERFKQLREEFSKKDENGNIKGANILGIQNKPLVKNLKQLNTNLKWILPVVSLKKKIYSMETRETSEDIQPFENTPQVEVLQIKQMINELNDVQKTYLNKGKNETTTTKYETMCKIIDTYLVPYLTYPMQDNLFNEQVHTNIESIIENLDEYKSVVYSNNSTDRIESRPFVIQKYIGSSLKNKGNNETINIKSLLMMPLQIMQFSRIEYPTTSILNRSLYSHTYPLLFRLFPSSSSYSFFKKRFEKKFVSITKTNEMDYEEIENTTNIPLFSTFKEYAVEDIENEKYNEQSTKTTNKYDRYLNNIIPNTPTLIGKDFHFFEKMMNESEIHGYSFIEIVRLLEPYMIYSKDITYGSFKKINYYIKQKIKNYIQKYNVSSREYRMVRDATFFPKSVFENTILSLFKEKEDIKTLFLNSYFKSLSSSSGTESSSSSENYFLMLGMDFGTVLYSFIHILTTALTIPQNLIDAIKPPMEPDLDPTTTSSSSSSSTDCNRRFITKKYKSLKELQNDNHKEEVFYDKEFDNSPYQLLKDYKKEKQQMTDGLFLEFFTENLIQKHSIPKNISKEIAQTIIRGKKQVQDGEYAILESYPTMLINEETGEETANSHDIINTYYKRIKNIWKRDEEHTAKEQDYIYNNNNNLFCNLNDTCVKRPSTDVCENTDDARKKLLMATKRRLLNDTIEKSLLTTKEELEKDITHKINLLLKTNVLKELQVLKYNNYYYNLGKTAKKDETIQSPYMETLDLILSQEDFVKKQKNVLTFVDKFAREPFIERLNEHPDWFYCRTTNTKLIPIYIYDLAKSYINGGSDEYILKLKEVVRKYGEKSDDDDAIVDRLSGRVMQKLDFVEEELYDKHGFHIVTGEVMQKDIATIIKETVMIKKKDRVFEDEQTETVYNIFFTLCGNMSISIDDETEDFVLRISTEVLKKILMSKDKYEQKEKEMMKKTNQPATQPFELYKNRTIILLVAFVTLVAIQIKIPSFHPNTTVPGCVMSFAGFPNPREDPEVESGLEYIACVLNISKTKDPNSIWYAMNVKNPVVSYKTNMKKMAKTVITREDIQQLYLKKSNYLMENPNESIIPKDQSLKKWTTFMPPIIKFNVNKTLEPLESGYFADMQNYLMKGDIFQWNKIGAIQSKYIQYSFGIIEYINNIVKKQNALLSTSEGAFYLQNACCNEDLQKQSTLQYFKEQEQEIGKHIEIIKRMSEMFNYNAELSTPSLFVETTDTRRKTSIIPFNHTTENIYASIIHYCKFDSVDAPIPNYLKTFIQTKPDLNNYNPRWSLQEKIGFLNENGKRFGEDDLNNLLLLVNEKNTVDKEETLNKDPLTIPNVNNLVEEIDALESENNAVIPDVLRKHLMEILMLYHPNEYFLSKNANANANSNTELDNKTDILKDYLQRSSGELLKNIFQFIGKYRGGLTDVQMNNMKDYMMNIIVWDEKENTDEKLPVIAQYIINAITNMSVVFPEMIINGHIISKTIPSHWDLSNFHEEDLKTVIEKQYNGLSSFIDTDVESNRSLHLLLKDTMLSTSVICDFIKTIPIIQSIKKTNEKEEVFIFNSIFDKSLLYSLFRYLFYSVIYEYISNAQNKHIIKQNILEIKTQKRQKQRNENVGTNENNNENEEEYEEDELPIPPINDQALASEIVIIQKQVTKLLYEFLSIENENKKTVNKSYSTILEKVVHSKLEEKKGVTDYFKNLSTEERKVETELKRMKMGRWNIGLQKGIFQYDKNIYDIERTNAKNKDGGDGDGGEILPISKNAEELDKDEEEQARQDELDEYGVIRGDGENDGVFYEDDQDDYGEFGDD